MRLENFNAICNIDTVFTNVSKLFRSFSYVSVRISVFYGWYRKYFKYIFLHIIEND